MEKDNNNNKIKHDHDEDSEAVVHALNGCLALIFPMVLRASIKLDLFEMIAGGSLTPSAIAARLPVSVPPERIGVLNSMLRSLTAHSFLTCTNDDEGRIEKRYALSPAGRCFVKDESSGGVSLAPFQAFNCTPHTMDFWFDLEGAILEKGTSFERVYGKHAYEYINSHPELGGMFNDAMAAHSALLMKKAVETYNGFEGLGSLVNVGGGYGVSLDMIVTKYPSIRGINFDLPEVIQNAPSYKGIEHIGGNMFNQMPEGDAILLKAILHNWSDEKCIILLKNCYKALPNKGKVIAIECIIPDHDIHQTDDVHVKFASQMDIIMQTVFGAKARTKDELRALAMKAGFSEFKIVSYVYGMWILEFLKLE